MKLDKAIKLGNEAEKSLRSGKNIEHADAIKMLIDTAHRAIQLRGGLLINPDSLFIGETEE